MRAAVGRIGRREEARSIVVVVAVDLLYVRRVSTKGASMLRSGKSIDINKDGRRYREALVHIRS